LFALVGTGKFVEKYCIITGIDELTKRIAVKQFVAEKLECHGPTHLERGFSWFGWEGQSGYNIRKPAT
jgi:hypothetical protein